METSLDPPPLIRVPMDQVQRKFFIGPKTTQTRQQERLDPHSQPNGPPPAEAPLSFWHSLKEISAAARPWPNALTLSASGRTKGNTNLCSRTTGMSCVRPHSRSITGRRPLHFHSHGACPTSGGKEIDRTGSTSTSLRGALFPSPHSPPGSPPQLRTCPCLPDSDSHMST